MKLSVLTLFSGAVLLAGCGSGATGSPTATPHTVAKATQTQVKPPAHHSATATSSAAATTVVPAASATSKPGATAAPTTSTSTPNLSATQASTTVAANITAGPAPKGSALQQGEAYMHRRDFANAEKSFKAAVKQNPKSIVAYEQLAFAALYYRDYPASYNAFKHASAIKPTDTRLLYYSGLSGMYAAQYVYARNYVAELVSLKPDYAPGYHLLFLIDTNLLDKKAQLQDAQALARVSPHDPNTYNDLGMAYANNSKVAKAYAYFSRAIGAQPKNWQYYKNRAIVDAMAKNAASELKDLRRALALAQDAATKKQLQTDIKALQQAQKKKK
jgi:tetratricopeptide (TPR) repeat protein